MWAYTICGYVCCWLSNGKRTFLQCLDEVDDCMNIVTEGDILITMKLTEQAC